MKNENDIKAWNEIQEERQRIFNALEKAKDALLDNGCKCCRLKEGKGCIGGKCAVYRALSLEGVRLTIKRMEHPERYRIKATSFTPEIWRVAISK